MSFWITVFAILVFAIIGGRFWYKRWRAQRIAARRRVELPNSHYASQLVRDQIDRERWGDLNLSVVVKSSFPAPHLSVSVQTADGPQGGPQRAVEGGGGTKEAGRGYSPSSDS